MSEKTVTRWYVQPKDAHTNEVLSEALNGLQCSEKFSTLECVDGEKRQLIEVPDHAFVARLYKSQTSLHVKFDVYRSQGNGMPGPWKFLKRTKTTLEKLKSKGILGRASTIPMKKATQF